MSAENVDPIARSVHDRLLKLAVVRKEDFNSILARYGNERLLYRLTRTRHGKRFVLKGASLFVLWLGRVHRPTRDLDLLASGRIDPAILTSIFRDVCQIPVEPDGLRYDPASITVTDIRAGQEYQGLRVKLRGLLGTARLSIQVDVGLGDAITPKPEEAAYPTLLSMPAPLMKVYPRETTIAEKLDTMLERGLKNSRMKDYYDIALLSQHFAFDGSVLQTAIKATLQRRGHAAPASLPAALTDAFATDRAKSLQWNAFLRTHRSSGVSSDLAAVVRQAREFLAPPLYAIAGAIVFDRQWHPGGPWQSIARE